MSDDYTKSYLWIQVNNHSISTQTFVFFSGGAIDLGLI